MWLKKILLLILINCECCLFIPWMVRLKVEEVDLSGMALLFRRGPEGNSEILKYQCQGFLVDSNIVLTVADCLPSDINANQLDLRLYNWFKYKNINPSTPYTKRNISEIIYHPLFLNATEGPRRYNFAALILESPINLPKTIKLPDVRREYSDDCTSFDLLGNLGTDEINIIPNFAGITSDSYCFGNENMMGYGLQDSNEYESFFCAGNDPKIRCGGNLGNPLMCSYLGDKKHHVLTGILLNRNECNLEYADIKYAYLWIQELKLLKKLYNA